MTVATPKPKLQWVLTALCLVAILLSGWLTYQKLTGKIDSLVGCGKGSDCSNILGSRWSVVFGRIPVSLPSMMLYVGLVVSMWSGSEWARKFRILAAWVLLGAAAWFIGLQVVAFSGFCKYCMATHALGAAVALGLLLTEGRQRLGETVKLLPVSALAVLALILLQVFGPAPKTHRVDSVEGSGQGGVHAAGDGRLVTYLGGKDYRVDSLPHLGKVGAKHVLVKYFDYTCDSCRTVDGYLEEALRRYPDDIAVIVLPVPLNKACNRRLPSTVKDHDKACEFARYALAVWKADSAEFADYHHWLFLNSDVSLGEARERAIEQVGEQAFQSALASEWIEEMIKANCEDYRLLIQRTPVMPKVLLGGKSVLQGASATTESFINELRLKFSLPK